MIVWLVVLAWSGLAADTNQTVAVPTNKPAEVCAALGIVSAVGSAGDAVQAVVVSTNKPLWEGNLSLGLTLTRGNSETLLANTAFLFHRNNLTNEWTFGGDAAYGEDESVENTETLHGFAQYNHLFSGRCFAYARADGLHDGIADVRYRVTVSPGVGCYFIKTRATLLAGEVGPGAVFERLDGHANAYLAPRFAERFEHKFDNQARVWEKAEFLPEADRWGNFLVNAEVGIEAGLTRRVHLQTLLQDNFANEPAPGRRNNDVKLISGLVYKF